MAELEASGAPAISDAPKGTEAAEIETENPLGKSAEYTSVINVEAEAGFSLCSTISSDGVKLVVNASISRLETKSSSAKQPSVHLRYNSDPEAVRQK